MFKRFFLVAVVALTALSLLGLDSAQAAEASTIDTAVAADEFVAHINDLRASQGLPALSVDPGLTMVAMEWTQQMAATDTLSHRPNLAEVAPSDWTRVGENVGVGSVVGTLHEAFVNSPGHYANLVHPAYRYIGVAVVMSGSTMWVTENFMAASRPAPVSTAAAPAGGEAALAAAAPAPAAAAKAASCKPTKAKKCKKVVVRKAKVQAKAKARRVVSTKRRGR
jgi:hypothetical protein